MKSARQSFCALFRRSLFWGRRLRSRGSPSATRTTERVTLGRISTGAPPGAPPGVPSDVLSDVLSGVPSGVLTHVPSSVPSGVLFGATFGVPFGSWSHMSSCVSPEAMSCTL